MAVSDLTARVRRRPWHVVLLLALLLAAGYGVWSWLFGPGVPAYAVVRGDLVQTVVASGRVVNPLRVDIGSQITGTVTANPVEAGETVTAGQVLITLESDEVRKQVEQARFAVAQAEARVRQIRQTGLPTAEQSRRQAETTLADASRQYERVRDLHAKGFVGQAQLDDAQRSRDLAESQARSARLQVEDSRAGGSAARMADMALSEARARLEAAEATLEHGTIRAPRDGTVMQRNVERGDVVQPGKVLMLLSPSGETQLVVQIDERNLSLLALGQQALASADAYPAQRFPAEVVYINPSVDPQQGSIEVRLRVPAPPAYLRQDMTVSVDVEVNRRTATLALPVEAVHESTAAVPWVLKVDGSHARRQAVRVGVRGGGRLEILEGLQAGDVVISASAANVREGTRVRTAVQPWQ